MSENQDKRTIVHKQADIDYRFHSGQIAAEQAQIELAALLGVEKVEEMVQEHQKTWDHIMKRGEGRNYV